LRVSSVDALLNLLSLMQNYDLGHEMVLRLLLPAPVRVDSLVNLLHDVVAQEREEGEEEPEPTLAVEPALERPDEGTEAMRTRSSLVSIDKAYTGTTPRTVKLLGKRYEVRTWKEAALRVFEVLRVRNQERFEEVAVTAVGRTRPYITRNRDLLRMPERIPHTELYFETNLSSNWIVRLCTTLVLGMGHSRSDIEFRIAD
jgi:hypothetical protein